MDKQSFADISSGMGRLDLYLLSNGAQLPKDWKTYKSGPNKGLCLFCKSPQTFHLIYKYDVAGTKSSAVDTGTMACLKCISHVRKMEDTLPGMASTQSLPSDLIDVEHIIDEYVFHNTLPENWFQHILYNKHGGRRSRCFFCDGGIDTNKPTELTLPVTHGQYLTGGRVHVCSSCIHMYMQMTSGLSILKDSCYQCGDNYPIDDLEYAYRETEKTMGHHSCPECTNVLVIETDKVEPNEDGFLRNNIVPCVFCAHDLSLDSTLSEVLLNDRRRSGKGFVCNECMLEMDMANDYRILNRKPIGIKITEEYVQYVYELNLSKVLVRKVMTNGTGRAFQPTLKKELINILLKNGS
jgi:hypothetical protein